METKTQLTSGLGYWLNNSVTLKLFVIGLLAIVLLIPSFQVTSLIRERQQRQRSVVAEIGRSWSGPQVLGGPVLVVPYKTMVKTVVGDVEKLEERVQHLYMLPEDLHIAAETDTKLLHRGIFDAAVYEAKVGMKGRFGPLDLAKADVTPEQVLWEKARLAIGVGDLRGLKNSPTITLGEQAYEPETEYADIGVFSNNLVTAPKLSGEPWEQLPFALTLDLRGSESLRFLQLAKHTHVEASGNWGAPKFFGKFLPDEREIRDSGFTAQWEVPHFSRTLPQQWTAAQATIGERIEPDGSDDYYEAVTFADMPVAASADKTHEATGFGIQFLQPVDHYQKAERTAKYAILIIVLTFVALFFTEVITKRRIHIIQYVLIGAAMIVYYTLLLSFSEQVGFNAAYAIASVATIALIGGFLAQLLHRRRVALIFSAILTVFYVFIFVIIQLQDMALLFGSIGLFITVALLMYFSGRINWMRTDTDEVAVQAP
ncbi:cell envelope integrity protein CreD [Parapedobacter defluvii]|uniref:Cell envelope integrity protein CreD n=1 Tax=Parapedobacter defluvii TaxID=2045106 RepID=A0ABQ1L3F6_9SPHI|nr:cell envelope integrity protein CreD [Parapedobacter defluvii]GGC14971.1 cell envelope integrity protein CreD [Parapedobacter defluvii]